ncbi:histidine phosphatase family protein [Chloroflexota bacterium]
MRIILVRHGETDWNQVRRVQGGSSNTPLNENGRQQVERLALKLKLESVQAIYSSPLQRAWDTARAIARYHQLEVEIAPLLREIEVGQLEGTSVAEMGKRLDQLLTEESQNASPPRMPGGESLAELQQRAWAAIQCLVDKHREGVLVVVSHYFTILTIICSVLNLPVSQIGRFRLGTASISAIIFDEQNARLVLYNEIVT